ncbi:PQQ-dependent sugar dehydrogenase [uncultured Friedmanniella sp.]|uniref:PQQ-dependent sugar dehydrogenase n=1 Tax=uncultured Friedmanniella sp. TaxID=335381 RepID=UPI0035C98D5D
MSRWKNWTVVAATGALSASALIAGPAEVAAAAAPTYAFTTVVSGVAIPWDVTWVGSTMLFDQRAGGVYTVPRGGAPQRVTGPFPQPFAESEGGVLGMVADPNAATNRVFYLCQTVQSSKDVQVRRYRLSKDGRSAATVGTGKPLIKGIPLSSGRHSGCRLRFSAKGMLYVGTGDAAQYKNPQRKSSLGGKVLRIHPDGRLATSNPYYRSGGNARYIWNYGHRNVQGLALQPGTDRMYSAEQGTDRDDEVNLVRKGANYGWDPGPRGGYDENRPMTDLKKYPKAVSAIWKSGDPTKATSGITFLQGSTWGTWNGALAVARLKANGVQLLFLNKAGKVTSTKVVPGTKAYGRVRTVQLGPDGVLYFTTSNSEGSQRVDKIVRMTPR